ncbi:hypothetical protein ASD24_24775 [Paenibacillus sp. Root52]|uniref:hypothetical protein n=1 Tax=Paenibacillus sp. Root52 TaxID=1736552 RepID=UPI0006F9E980|nr:hypothetical protein [Paenibacillus sp. Root52]KQY91013.1 hypothetical protein ASD24_24775 [Paenibacillus sp. Root52]
MSDKELSTEMGVEKENMDAVQSAKEKSAREKTDSKKTKEERESLRLLKEDKGFIKYWAEVFDMNKTELMMRSVRHYVAWRNQDFDLPTAEMQRLNQLIDAMNNMVSSNERLANTVTNGFDSMMGIMRGENYLLETEDGDLSEEERYRY